MWCVYAWAGKGGGGDALAAELPAHPGRGGEPLAPQLVPLKSPTEHLMALLQNRCPLQSSRHIPS